MRCLYVAWIRILVSLQSCSWSLILLHQFLCRFFYWFLLKKYFLKFFCLQIFSLLALPTFVFICIRVIKKITAHIHILPFLLPCKCKGDSRLFGGKVSIPTIQSQITVRFVRIYIVKWTNKQSKSKVRSRSLNFYTVLFV